MTSRCGSRVGQAFASPCGTLYLIVDVDQRPNGDLEHVVVAFPSGRSMNLSEVTILDVKSRPNWTWLA